MDLKTISDYLDQKPGATPDFPFGPDAMVYKVMGKMFALISLENTPLRMNLKCDPDHALALRSMYQSVLPGYHMNKNHWNTLVLDGTVPADHIFEMVDDSYKLVVRGLKKADREKLSRSGQE
ncbi:MAG: MmcQ/YjbR family DNA-binding protein [Desulfatibacillum sp.]|nr:MmcQ/YjbR family DNA-binding protein [Desulfatibacillum sp.]